jgi:hypothetical protein
MAMLNLWVTKLMYTEGSSVLSSLLSTSLYLSILCLFPSYLTPFLSPLESSALSGHRSYNSRT